MVWSSAVPMAEKATPTSSEESERRLWFDYVSKLNDRALQANSTTGATNWVLVAAAVAIIYKCVSQMPVFAATSGALRASLVILLLEIDSLLHYATAFAFLALYAYPTLLQKRLTPEPLRRLSSIRGGVLLAVLSVAALAHFGIALWARNSHIAAIALTAWGCWWVVNLQSAIRKKVKSLRKARRLGKPLPVFQGLGFDPDLGSLVGFILLTSLGTAGTVPLCLYVARLAGTATGWITPLSAANYVVALAVILALLLDRLLQIHPQATYQELERAILTDQLSPSDIRARFVAATLGPSTEEWLRQLNRGVDEAVAKLQNRAEAASQELQKLEAIEPSYAFERRGRAGKLLNDLNAATEEFRVTLENYRIEMEEYAQTRSTPGEGELLQRIVDERKPQLEDLKRRTGLVGDLIRKFSELAKAETNSASR